MSPRFNTARTLPCKTCREETRHRYEETITIHVEQIKVEYWRCTNCQKITRNVKHARSR